MLPDDVLLEIFDLYRKNHECPQQWRFLVHVCRRWRQITFASPRRLNLQVLCKHGTPVRKYLDIWPTFPIVVAYGSAIAPDDEDNAIAALEHPDRVCRIELHVTESQIGKIVTVMQVPFPVLTQFSLATDLDVPVIPSGLLGGSAPCLQKIKLDRIPFPALPTFLLSASNLIELRLWGIPPTGYISPEAMVAGLAALPRLVFFQLDFQPATPIPDRSHPPPVTRTILPALTHLTFLGGCEYLEDFLARIDAPHLRWFQIIYWDLVDFEAPQLCRFINRSENLKKILSRRCKLALYRRLVEFAIACTVGHISVRVACEGTDWQISQIIHALRLISPILFDMVHFSIWGSIVDLGEVIEDNILEDIEWLQLLRLFPSVKTLFVSGKIAGRVARVLEDIAGMIVTGVLPALDLLCLEQQPLSSVDEFIAFRRDSGHPVTIINVRKEFDDRLEAYL